MHIAQEWKISISSSACAPKLRLMSIAFLVCASGYLTFTISPLSDSLRWWGDWLWPWPLLLYAAWMLVHERAPLLPPQQLRLTESGQLGHCQIKLGLITPWLIAIHCKSLPAREHLYYMQTRHLDVLATPGTCAWQWLCKDQLSQQDWARLARVCRHSKNRKQLTRLL